MMEYNAHKLARRKLLFTNRRTKTQAYPSTKSNIFTMIIKPRFLLGVVLTAASLMMGGLVRSQSFTCSYPDPVAIHSDGAVLLEYYMNGVEGTFTMRVTYLAGHSWVGIGINTAGDDGMVPALAVIGRLEDDGTGALSVKRYILSSDAKDGSGVQALDDVHGQLRDASFVQTENGESILEFTHDLEILSEDDASGVVHTVTADSTWIWAVGLADNVWEGKHRVHGSFAGFQMQDTCSALTEDPSWVSTVTPATMEPSDAGSEATMTPTEGNADAAADATGEPAVEPATPPVAEEEDPDDDEEEDSGTDSEDEEATEAPVDTGATAPSVGGGTGSSTSSGSQSGLIFGESDSNATRGLWVAHGILMGVAWGVFAPLTIGAACLRNMKCLRGNALWLRFHLYLALSVAVLTICGFALAVAATQQEGDLPHFNDEPHRKAGLAIFILVLFQGLAGYFRPGLPKAGAPKADGHSLSSESSFTSAGKPSEPGVDGSIEVNEEAPAPIWIGKKAPKMDPAEVDRKNCRNDAAGVATPPKSMLRQYWEYLHRFLGICLLGLAWWNCQTGIILQAEKYDEDDEQTLLDIFWGVAGGIAGVIFLVGYVLRME
jgi:hypothetical protein